MNTFLKALTDCTAPSGNEEAVMDILQSEITPFADELYKDVMGNLVARKKGEGKKILFAAHADEIGFIVSFIDDNGFLRFSTVGGIDNTNILNAKVVFKNGTIGVIGCPTDTPEASKDPKITNLFIDIGVADKKSAEALVKVGDVCGFKNSYSETDTHIISKSLDDRIGCYILATAMKQIQKTENDLYFVFTTQEEIGLRGSTTAAFKIAPDYAVAVDVCDTGDTPSALKSVVKLGGGIGIHVKDKRMVATPMIRTKMVDTAKELGLNYQMVVEELGSTDGSAIQLSGNGVATGVLDIPTRYIHSPSEMVCKADVADAISFVAKFAAQEF